MYGYIAMLANGHDRRSVDAMARLAKPLAQPASAWHCVHADPQLVVYHSGARQGRNRAYPLDDGAGVVLGSLFDQPRADSLAATLDELPIRERALIVDSCGRHLTTRYWGRYVAFIRERNAPRVHVLRDPTGVFPCYHAERDGVGIFFSRPEDCLLLGLPGFAINWQYVATRVVFRGFQSRETGLIGVNELQPGECIHLDAKRSSHTQYWKPSVIARSEVINDAELATALLRLTTKACVNAWASRYTGILHTLSGGLDSSIVLACLASAPSKPRVTCLNYVTRHAEGDERFFARQAAAAAGAELIEQERRPTEVSLKAILDIALSPKPVSYRYYLEHSRFEARLAQEKCADAVFSGGGGDQLFYRSRAILAFVDCLQTRAPGRLLAETAWSVARIEGRSIWSVLREGLGRAMLPKRWNIFEEFRRYRQFVSPRLMNEFAWSDALFPPALRSGRKLPPGKLWHARMLAVPQFYYDPLGHADDPERVYPLTSQPLIELCLRIPTYVLNVGGWDRAIARRSFFDDLPRAIASRRTKGHIDDHGRRLVTSNLQFIREFLLNGELVTRGLVDGAKIDEVLSGRMPLAEGHMPEILDHLSTEAWTARWSAVGRRAAA